MSSRVTIANTTQPTLGWQPGCSTRGTFDIIWSCAQTIALCAWVSVCTNLPAPHNGKWDLATDKFFFTLMTLLGPEIVFLLAFGQYHAAKASIQEFAELGYGKDKVTGYEGWTLAHGFYANMGGIHVQPKDWKSFPVNAKQLAWLVRHDYLEKPDTPDEPDNIRKITRREILARGKVDGLARFITVCQTLNFFVTTVARFVTGLAVSTLELTVLANIYCTLLTYIVWWEKPTDAELGHPPFRLVKTMEQILIEAGSDAVEYIDTPLDFVSRDEWLVSLVWRYYVNILRSMNILSPFNLHYDRPAQRVQTFDFPRLLTWQAMGAYFILALAYPGWFLGAWNFYFPSIQERTIWRVATSTQAALCLATTILGPVVEQNKIRWFRSPKSSTYDPQIRAKNDSQAVDIAENEKAHGEIPKPSLGGLWKLLNTPCSNEKGNFKCHQLPLKTVIIVTPICATYCVCRLYILVEDIIGLRSLPASAYQRVDWTPYWPWF